MNIQRIAIVGAGTMGTGIAQVVAQAGITVTIIDTGKAALDKSCQILQRSLKSAVEREKLTQEEADRVRKMISCSTEWDAIEQADWVIEAVFEEMAVKSEVLARIGAVAPGAAVISSNTSTLLIGKLGEASGRPGRFLGMHFFNPPPAMKLVEVIPSAQTLPEITDAAVELCRRMGKQPAVAPDIPGFFVNRCFGALLSAAIDIWVQGAAPADIDAAMELGSGHRMGPLATADLVGLDICLALLDSLHEQTGHARFEVAPAFREMVEDGKLGRKSGEGFYSYGE